MVSSPVERDTKNPYGIKKNSLAGHPKKQWQGTSLRHLWLVRAVLPGVVAMIANLVGHG